MSIIIDGKKAAEELRIQLKKETEKISGRKPGLAVVLVGEDPASKVYVGNKIKACEEVGFYSRTEKLSSEITEEELLKLIAELNNNQEVDGILVQLPLPKHIKEEKIINAISHDKDVDGFHPLNTGKLFTGGDSLVSCTPQGCIYLLKKYGVELQGKKAVVIGRSNIVGKPVGILLLNENCTLTFCHSRSKNIAAETSTADILIAAVGKAGFVTAEMVKAGAAVIDVGINRTEEGKLTGDVDFEEVSKKAGWITPVPGGVGPMTIAMLLNNTLKAYKMRKNK